MRRAATRSPYDLTKPVKPEGEDESAGLELDEQRAHAQQHRPHVVTMSGIMMCAPTFLSSKLDLGEGGREVSEKSEAGSFSTGS